VFLKPWDASHCLDLDNSRLQSEAPKRKNSINYKYKIKVHNFDDIFLGYKELFFLWWWAWEHLYKVK